jgi:AraC-like DNA-binding protein
LQVKEHIQETIHKTFLCTHIPICSFEFDGTLICSAGYTRQLESLFDQQNIFEQAKQQLLGSSGEQAATMICTGPLSYTAFLICTKNSNRGLHILGPYTTTPKTVVPGILYKPDCCIPHIITLVRNIAADSLYVKQKVKKFYKMPYSLYVKKALDCLDARYHEPITLSEVAKSLSISKCYFCSLFKKETGKTFSHYLNEVRIEKSKELLRKDHGSILDVALSVGFNNQNYYTVLFKKFTKKTPLEFRNAM